MNAGFDADRLTDFATVNDFLDAQKVDVPATVLVHRQEPAGLLGHPDHLRQVSGAEGHRLFANNVFTGAHRLDSQGAMAVVGGGDEHHLDGGVRQQILEALVHVYVPGAGILATGLLDVPDAGNLQNVPQLPVIVEVPGSHTTQADDCYFVFHNAFPP